MIVRFKGGLGNQMFQYAFVKQLELVYGIKDIKVDLSFFNKSSKVVGTQYNSIDAFNVHYQRATAEDLKRACMFRHNQKPIAGKKQKLLTWLNKQSLYSLIAWFDAIEETNVSSQIKSRRWNTEVLERDHMFLSMLGVTAFD